MIQPRPPANGQFLAAHIRGAKYAELDAHIFPISKTGLDLRERSRHF